MTIVFISHNQSLIEAICSTVLVLKRGSIDGDFHLKNEQ